MKKKGARFEATAFKFIHPAGKVAPAVSLRGKRYA
jgi:hypothetical protein